MLFSLAGAFASRCDEHGEISKWSHELPDGLEKDDEHEMELKMKDELDEEVNKKYQK